MILTAIIPLVLIVIERTAILMQDPFENAPMDTPMTSISQTIERNIMDMLEERIDLNNGPDSTYILCYKALKCNLVLSVYVGCTHETIAYQSTY